MPIRVIPRIDIKGFNVVKGIHLEGLRVVGQPAEMALNYYQMGADEIILIDVVASLYNRKIKSEVLSQAVKNIFVPVIMGGGVRSVDDAALLFRIGADKVAINTAALNNPKLLTQISDHFGSQSVVLSIEAKKCGASWEAYANNGRDKTGIDVIEWIEYAQTLGIGELLLTSIDFEGTQTGFDIELISRVAPLVDIPLIVCGGFGESNHLKELIEYHRLDGIVISSALHYKKTDVDHLKKAVTEFESCIALA